VCLRTLYFNLFELIVQKRRLSRVAAVLVHKSGEHLGGVHGDEQALAARQHFAGLITDLGNIEVLAPAYGAFASNCRQWHTEGHRPEVFDFHGLGERNHGPELVHFAHRFIKNSGNDSPVRVTGWALILLRQAKVTNCFITMEVKLQPHAFLVVFSAAKASVLWHFYGMGVVAGSMDFFWHGRTQESIR
jgi:hypothetical protein